MRCIYDRITHKRHKRTVPISWVRYEISNILHDWEYRLRYSNQYFFQSFALGVLQVMLPLNLANICCDTIIRLLCWEPINNTCFGKATRRCYGNACSLRLVFLVFASIGNRKLTNHSKKIFARWVLLHLFPVKNYNKSTPRHVTNKQNRVRQD